ncbi:N-acetylmuramoyl-L-alanine amidase [Halomonas cupida]|uniref:N-acetylmuramoyl-L-alanine amidase n=1 Tax=Halomonas cupida TaxID=44933 RepID=A0A1M7KHZ1_9GAMM|nr:N-acetylmuramoyl-L-alanine amidase [Halomonas cupida]GEN25391.1 N-acetylmuramoyl-L-alanine amidase [Halomonas cupida]SHM64690.1 N-acetylmuramoyl-L-alanine amidase [Halomonas cupida]
MTLSMPIPVALQTRSLFISAGHSMTDPGAVGNGLNEADIVLDFRDRLYEFLADRIVLARDGKPGINLPLRQACEMAKRHDIAVEFHCNAAESSSATGTETLSAPSDDEFGDQLCTAIADTLNISNRGDKGEGDGQHSRLAFIRAGGVIVELFFITNSRDLAAYHEHLDALVGAVGRVLISRVCVSDHEAAAA